ncbi:uncharacterized protein BDW70DRAFT_170941 [Aspergillus foveolatus]|uniref:uncharacterized protein n=1 Tax=Aspergillus foveolatus TaxID=210207 RepID=UPI003CCD90B1
MYVSCSAVILSLLLLTISFKSTTSAPNSPRRKCRCLPNDPCWPSAQTWSAFNQSVNGHLISLRPIGAVCHGREFNEAECAFAQQNTYNAQWRASQPGALQTTNWESRSQTLLDCDLNSPREAPCTQGRIPVYAVLAESAEEIQKSVRFARDKNLRVVTRNTGHNALGQSSAPGSLQINTSRLKRIEPVSDFIPQGADASVGQAATLGAGVLALEVAQVGLDQGFIAIMGLCNTVGTAGGFIQGGGIGLLGPLYGMGSDTAVEFNVVTAEGDLVVANAFQNADLFWALRGGGGGTFGIAVNTTIRVFADVPGIAFSLYAQISRQDPRYPDSVKAIFDITRQIVGIFPALRGADDATSGYVIADITLNSTTVQVLSEILFPNTTDIDSIRQRLRPLMATLDDMGLSPVYTTTLTAFPGLSTFLNLTRVIPATGRLEGSVMVSERLLLSRNGPSHILDVTLAQDYANGDQIEFFMSAGGQVKTNKGVIDSGLNPAWREAGMLITLRRILPTSSATKRFVNNPLPALRRIETPRLGSYINAADPDEPGFQRAFWGSNYERLYRIKQKWDRDGLFVVNSGVGSEDWGAEQICRVR